MHCLCLALCSSLTVFMCVCVFVFLIVAEFRPAGQVWGTVWQSGVSSTGTAGEAERAHTQH